MTAGDESAADLPGAEPDPAVSAAQKRRTLIVNIIRWVLIVLVVAAATFQLWVNWQVVVDTVTEMQWPRVMLAFVGAPFFIYLARWKIR